MNRKNIDLVQEGEQQKSGEYAVRRSRWTDVIAALVCIVLAFAVWLLVMSRTDNDYFLLEVADPAAGYTYSFSTTHLEVKGSVADLRATDSVAVRVPATAPGTYEVTEADLILPDGISLVSTLKLTVTVSAK